MASVTFESVRRVFPGHDRPAVEDLDLEIHDGEFMVFVGPSGCGKSTSLRMLAGLEEVSAGRILVGGRDVTEIPPRDRDIAMVFQNYALYPHMTVRENMGFALKLAKTDRSERDRRVEEAALMLELTDYLDRKPKALSGGQRQRVAMGRAIVREPQVFLMDEPLSNLDTQLRVSTRTQISAMQRRLGITTVYVTHDQVEAMTMGDRVAVLKDGVLQQVDTPLALYERPANLFVAGFIGSPGMNLLETSPENGVVAMGHQRLPLPRQAASQRTSDRLILGVRPEHWRFVTAGEGLEITINHVEDLGSVSFVYGSVEHGGTASDVVVRTGSRSGLVTGQSVEIAADPDGVVLFDIASGQRLAA